MIGFEGRLQWRRQKLFKLHAKPSHRKKNIRHKGLGIASGSSPNLRPHPKFAIRSFLVRRTKNEQRPDLPRQASSDTAAIIGFGAFPSPGFMRKS
jgi:hypothetical protein